MSQIEAASLVLADEIVTDDAAPDAAPVGKGVDLMRLFDIAAAAMLLIFFAPVLLLVALLVALQDGGPALFGHTRIGRSGVPFKCWKFRTMIVNAEEKLNALLATNPAARAEWETNQKLRRDPRVTLLGRILRTTSLDEFPQLLNVLKGDMSLVGPRPVVLAEIPRYGRSFRHYAAVRPGITGVWQVSGRSEVSYTRRVAMDVYFVRNRSVRLYFVLLIVTIPSVLTRRGSY